MSERGRRRANEDAVLLVTLSTGAELAAVADGMGGYAGGEVASQRALEVLRTSLERGSELADAVHAANAAVYEEASRSSEHQGMGTTLVALLRRGGQYSIVNVGDSRAYRVDAAGIQQLTRDHSFVADAIRAGQLTAEDAEKSRWRNAVTRAVGTQREVEVDSFGPFDALEAHVVVLCTDGLYRTVAAADVQRVVQRARTPDRAVRELAKAAFDGGSDDNISVVLLRFGADAGADVSTRSRAGSMPADAAAVDPRTAGVVAAATPDTAPSPTRGRRRHRRRRGRWTLLEIVLIFLGIVVLSYAILRMLAS